MNDLLLAFCESLSFPPFPCLPAVFQFFPRPEKSARPTKNVQQRKFDIFYLLRCHFVVKIMKNEQKNAGK